MRKGLGFHNRHSAGGFNPASLFAGGTVQGFWYDPSDLTTLFQDSAGTTPVTAVEQPVGLMLDKRVPVAQTGYYSGVFDGTGDYLSLANNAAFSFGSGAFTVEAWIYLTAITGGTQCIASNYQNSANGWALQVGGSNLIFSGSGDGADITGATTLAANTWYHVAVSGQSGSIRLFLNGSQQSSTYTGAVALDSTAIMTVGGLWAGTLANPFNGYISNVRIIKGTALYTGTFTPPTAPLTVVSGTSLLTCQNATFIDNSGNGFAITANGDAKTGARNPFGNHAFQSTSASRPTLRARYNLLTYSEQFDNAAWGKGNASVTANTSVAPDGTTTADTFTSANSNAQHYLQPNAGASINTPNVNYTNSISVKAGTHNFVTLSFSSGGPTAWVAVTVNLSTGQITQTANGAAGTLVSSSIASQGNGWYRVTFTASYASGGPGLYLWVSSSSSGTPTYGNYGMEFWAAAGTETILVWGAQLTQTAVFPSNVYQRVGAATDYATGAAFPVYLAADGIDDSMLTNSVDFATVTSDGQARRNLLSFPTQFDDAYWQKISGGVGAANPVVTPNAAIAPDGTTTADRVVFVGGADFSLLASQNVTVSSTSILSLYVSSATGLAQQLVLYWRDGTVDRTLVNVPATGWARVTLPVTVLATDSVKIGVRGLYYPSVTSADVFIWGAQLETGSTATAFQNIGTDKMLVVAGVTKNSDATAAIVAELSANWNSNAGSFVFTAPSAAPPTNDISFGSRGSAAANANQGVSLVAAAPTTRVISTLNDIAASTTLFRSNGADVGTATGTKGTGNFGNYPLFIGRRNNATAPFNGSLFSLIIAGQSYSASQISSTESWVAAKTPLGTI